MDKIEKFYENNLLDEDSPAAIKNVYNEYKCECNGKSLKWTRGNMLFQNDLKCGKCNNGYGTNSCGIRWTCETCKNLYCDNCFPIAKKTNCPENHVFQEMDRNIIGVYICDSCFKRVTGEVKVYFDATCNLGFCKECVANS